jgi:N-acetylglucosaminyl-diphospho-decaprenol L-rhamnosyltransferase
MNKVDISVIIANYNGGKFLQNCLNSLINANGNRINSNKVVHSNNLDKHSSNSGMSPKGFLNYEVIVVDDGSEDDSVKVLREVQRYRGAEVQIKLIENKRNLGAAKARNIGAKAARGKYLFFLDVDTEVLPGCLEAVFSYLNRHPGVGAVQAKLLKGRSAKIDSAGHHLTIFGFPYEIGVGEDESCHTEEKPIFGARTAGFGIKKVVFNLIGGFDEDYVIYGEDTDLSWRIWLSGNEIHYLPTAEIRHFEKSSLTSQTKPRLFEEGAKNQVANILKNSGLSRLWFLLPGNITVWGWLAFWFFLRGKEKYSLAVIKGLVWNMANLSTTLKKRKQVEKYTVSRLLDPNLVFGSASLGQLLKKGRVWLQNV